MIFIANQIQQMSEPRFLPYGSAWSLLVSRWVINPDLVQKLTHVVKINNGVLT